MQTTFTIASSARQETIDITDTLHDIVAKSNMREGICTVFLPHATAAIILNENADPNIGKDFHQALRELIPQGRWLHDEIDNNADAHIKSALIGPSETIPIADGRLQLGRWQSCMVAECDGPKQRTIIVTITQTKAQNT